MRDDDHARKLYDQEEYELYRKVCDEMWIHLPECYRKNGRDHWRYKERLHEVM